MEPSAFGVLVCYIKGDSCILLKTNKKKITDYIKIQIHYLLFPRGNLFSHLFDAKGINSREVRSQENYFFTFKPIKKCVNSVFIEAHKQKQKGSYIRGNICSYK